MTIVTLEYDRVKGRRRQRERLARWSSASHGKGAVRPTRLHETSEDAPTVSLAGFSSRSVGCGDILVAILAVLVDTRGSVNYPVFAGPRFFRTQLGHL